jgi:photosystem II stability/assembly factor-like uncharacterized protein
MRNTAGPTEKQSTVRTARRRVARKDFHRVGPAKVVPGVVGRSTWFAERAGNTPAALSIGRMQAALAAVEAMEEHARGPDRVLERAYELLNSLGTRKRPSGPILVEASGRSLDVKGARPARKAGVSGASKPVRVPELRSPWGMLFLPPEKDAAAYLDLDEVVGAELSDRGNPRLVEWFSYLPEHQLIAGQVERGGIYQAFAFPKHPWIHHAFEVLCHHWKWVAVEPALRELSNGGARERLPIVDRICQLILCPPYYSAVDDPGFFSRAGIGFPPGFEGGEGWPGDPVVPGTIGGSGNICERCLGGFLGEIDVIDEIVVPPPIVKWCWRRRPRCSRWRSIGPFPGAGFAGIGRVSQMDVHPTNGNILIAGAAGGGVWRTDDGGTTWHALMELQPTLTIGAVAIAPSNPKVLYAASGEDGGGWDPAWSGVGVYRSSDGGSHWTLCTAVPSTRFSALQVHPGDADTVYAAGNAGLHKSKDGGITWVTNPGLGSLLDGQITDVVIAHDDPDRIYVGVSNDGVYRSTTGGEQVGATPAFTRLDGVNQLPSGAAAAWTKLAIGRNGANRSSYVVAKLGPAGSRIFRTTDGGGTWTELAPNVASVNYDEWCSIIAVDPEDQDVMYAGAADALSRTTNGGANPGDWTSIYAGVHADQQDLCFDPNDPSRVFLANDGGVYRSANRGNTWELASGRLAITQLYDIDLVDRDKDVVAGGAQDNGIYYRSTTGAWTNIPWGDGTQVAVDPTDPRIFYFSSQNGLPTPPFPGGWLRKSVDGGASHQALGTGGLGTGGSPWVTIMKLDPTDPIANPATSRTLFVCGFNLLFRSTNGGQNWQRVDDGAGNPFTTNGTITALEFAPSDPSILYLGTSTGALYRAVSGGAAAGNWTRIDTVGTSADALFPNAQIQAVRVNPIDEDDVWVVFGGAGVTYTGRPNMILNPLGISHLFRSTDAGANWVDASGRFPALNLPDVPTSAAAISDVDSDIAYAGTDVGVFRTTDGGVTWTGFQDGLPRSPIVELRYNRRFDRLFAATMGRGVYVRSV